MSDFFSPKELPKATVDELEARSSIDFSKPWFTSRMPWIHIMSLAKECQSGDQQGKGIFTTNTVTNKPYAVHLEDGTTVTAPGYILTKDGRPGPAVTGIDVKKQGELGSTKRATITLQAFTDEQFQDIAKCYFIPGMSVRAQWGWNTSATGTKGASPITEPMLDTEATRAILKQQSVNPNYDGIQGRIVSYTADLAENSIWQITIEVIAAGSMIADVKASDYSLGCICTQEVPVDKNDPNSDTKTVSTKTSAIKAALLQLIKEELTIAELKKRYGGDPKVYSSTYQGYPIDENGVEDSSKILGLFPRKGGQKAIYIPLGFFQQIVTDAAQSTTSKDNKLFKIDSTKSILTQPTNNKGNGPKSLFCSDPRIAWLPGSKELSFEDLINSSDASSDSQITNAWTDDLTPPSAFNDSGIVLNNILINVKHAMKVLLSLEGGNDSVLDYLSTIMEDINHACGSPWEFVYLDSTESFVDSESEKNLIDAGVIVSIVDTKGLMSEPPQPYEFKANAQNSNVISIGMNLKLTEAMKTQALYSNKLATKQSCNNRFNAFQQFSGYNLGQTAEENNRQTILDALKLYKEKKETGRGEGTITFYIRQAAKNPNLIVDSNMLNSFKIAYNQYSKSCGSAGTSCDDTKKEEETYAKRLDALKNGVEDTTVNAIYGDLVELCTTQNEKDPCAGSILPVEFNVTVEGIGGIKFGQLVTCNRFPQDYTKIMHHQVVGVEHTINSQGWTTSIKTVGRYKN